MSAPPALITSSFSFAFHSAVILLVLFGITNRTSNSPYALKYKLDWSSKVGLAQVFVIAAALNYTFWKLLQSVIGTQSADHCKVLCQMSAFSFPMLDFAVYTFLRIRNEKAVAQDENPARKIFEKILFALTFITPILAILNAVYGSGIISAKTKSCVTQPNPNVALTVSVFEIIINFGFLTLFILPLREFARDKSALDSKKVQEISRRNFVSCLLCVIGGVFTNSAAAALSLTTTAAPVSPYLVIGSIVVVIGLLYSTWKAWEWKLIGLGKARVIDENGDARPSDAAPPAHSRTTRVAEAPPKPSMPSDHAVSVGDRHDI